MACLATFVVDYLLALFGNFCFLWNSFGLFLFNKRFGLFGWNLRNLRSGLDSFVTIFGLDLYLITKKKTFYFDNSKKLTKGE